MIYRLEQPQNAAPLFGGWEREETFIASCLSGRMGDIYADHPQRPSSEMALLGDFRFFAGTPSRELALFRPETACSPFFIAVPRDQGWSALLSGCYGERARPALRYATKKEPPETFCRDHLEQAAASLPAGYALRPIDEELFALCGHIHWCADWVRHFPDWETFRKYALGVAVMQNGEPVAGASSYSSYPGGIEVEIDTRSDHRRKGLAYAAGASLILRCLDRGLYPSWDAQNLGSLALAEKLGYHFSRQYPVFEVTE